MKKRTFLKHLAWSIPVGTLLPKVLMSQVVQKQASIQFPYELPPMNYAYYALEPYIDRLTMEIHHGKHHAAYVNNLNKALENSDLQKETLEALFQKISTLSPAIRNNGGGHWNHTFFWTLLSPKPTVPSAALRSKIEAAFGSMETFKEKCAQAALGRFGSGWVWLIWNGAQLEICSTPNQDNPLMDVAEKKGTPILALDVWEHAYYLKYQNKRADYVQAFWNVVDWSVVEKNLNEVAK